MSFESFSKPLSTSDEMVFRMPAYKKTRDGEYAILPQSGAIRVSVYNSTASAETATIKLKTIFDIDPVTIGEIEVGANTVEQFPVPISLGPGDFVTALAGSNSAITLSGTVTASPIAPQTADGSNIWSAFTMRRPIDHTIAWAVASRTFGSASADGYFAGVIDTVTATIDSADAYQTGEKFALLVSPKSLENGPGLQWDNTGTGFPFEAGALTRWDGLSATNAVLDPGGSQYEVHNYIDGLSSPVATEGGSKWYLPALDELELLYRNLKPNAEDNRTDSQGFFGGAAFPSTGGTHGTNISSDPIGTGYSNNPRDPDETPLDAFKEGGPQTLSQNRYWSATEADAQTDDRGRAWLQAFTDSGAEGFQAADAKDLTDRSVRPVRRVVL